MENFFLTISLALGFLVLLSLYRGVVAPTVLDRVVSVGDSGIKTTVMLIIMGLI